MGVEFNTWKIVGYEIFMKILLLCEKTRKEYIM